MYENDECSECLCKLGGVPHCTPKKCKPCEKNLKSTLTNTCKCTCQPCPESTTLCPTSNICINSTLWCNGIQDCPDDETNCITTVVPTIVTPTVEKCHLLKCPPGYKRVEKELKKSQDYYTNLSPMFSYQTKKKTQSYQNIKSVYIKKPILQVPEHPVVEKEICPEYRCESEKPPTKYVHDKKECPSASCPLGYVPFFEDTKTKECPKYTCNLPPPPDAVCNITGRTFNTFDGTEFKYDICNHVLARDLLYEKWDISCKIPRRFR